jgi:hypothetical protein
MLLEDAPALQVGFPDGCGGLVVQRPTHRQTVLNRSSGNQRQSKMSLVFLQICNDFRLPTLEPAFG